MYFSGAWHLRDQMETECFTWVLLCEKLLATRQILAPFITIDQSFWHVFSLVILFLSVVVPRLPLNFWSMHKEQSLMSRKMYRSLTPEWLEIPGIPRRNDVSHRNKLFDSTKRIRALKNLKGENKRGKSCIYYCRLDFYVQALLFLCEAHSREDSRNIPKFGRNFAKFFCRQNEPNGLEKYIAVVHN